MPVKEFNRVLIGYCYWISLCVTPFGKTNRHSKLVVYFTIPTGYESSSTKLTEHPEKQHLQEEIINYKPLQARKIPSLEQNTSLALKWQRAPFPVRDCFGRSAFKIQPVPGKHSLLWSGLSSLPLNRFRAWRARKPAHERPTTSPLTTESSPICQNSVAQRSSLH